MSIGGGGVCGGEGEQDFIVSMEETTAIYRRLGFSV